MTENEALRYMVSYKMGRGCKPQYPDAVLDEAFSTTITALKEIQQYRKFGTLEEFYKAKKYIDLAKNHGTIGEVIDECAEYEAIGTVEECRKAVEKQEPKKPRLNYKPKFFGKATYTCPRCGNCRLEEFANERQNNNYCWDCGQRLDFGGHMLKNGQPNIQSRHGRANF